MAYFTVKFVKPITREIVHFRSHFISDNYPPQPGLLGQFLKQMQHSATNNGACAQVSLSPLTERELEVLQRMGQGDSNKEIARDLELSAQTVKNHITNIFRKLKVDRRTRAVLIAIENGLIKNPTLLDKVGQSEQPGFYDQ